MILMLRFFIEVYDKNSLDNASIIYKRYFRAKNGRKNFKSLRVYKKVIYLQFIIKY